VFFNRYKTTKLTAGQLGITQPAVSQHLKTLEEFFDKPVFTFNGKKKTLTLFGEELAKNLTPQLDLIAQTLEYSKKSFIDLSTQTIRVGGRLGVIKKVVPFIEFPGAVFFEEMGSAEVMKSILENKIDYGFSRKAPDSLEIVSKKLIELPIHLVAHKSLFKTKNYLEEFKQKNLWEKASLHTYSKEIPYLSDWCKLNKIKLKELNIKFILNDWDIVFKMLSKNKGYTFCPAPGKGLDPNLISVPVTKDNAGSLELFLLYSKATKQLFPLERCFNLEQLKKLQGHEGL
jgi:DNA-binding transcriptional LysR family regulator